MYFSLASLTTQIICTAEVQFHNCEHETETYCKVANMMKDKSLFYVHVGSSEWNQKKRGTHVPPHTSRFSTPLPTTYPLLPKPRLMYSIQLFRKINEGCWLLFMRQMMTGQSGYTWRICKQHEKSVLTYHWVCITMFGIIIEASFKVRASNSTSIFRICRFDVVYNTDGQWTRFVKRVWQVPRVRKSWW